MYANTFKYKQISEDKYQVQLNQKYEVTPKNQMFYFIPQIIDMINIKDSQPVFDKSLKIHFYSSFELKLSNAIEHKQTCPICIEQFQIKDIEKQLNSDAEDDVYVLQCSHKFHKSCLIKFMHGKDKWLKCPICGIIYGTMLGDMPNGQMKINFQKNTKCKGYKEGTHVIRYQMPSGMRNGQQYPGTNRTAYIPDTPQGRQVVELLRQCFDRKLTFTIGTSVTTGLEHQIVWNGIHHKTNTSGGAANFGYPDETYLKRVKEQLAAKGIVPK